MAGSWKYKIYVIFSILFPSIDGQYKYIYFTKIWFWNRCVLIIRIHSVFKENVNFKGNYLFYFTVVYLCNCIHFRTNYRLQVWRLVRDWWYIYYQVKCFSYVILQFKVESYENFVTILHDFEKQWLRPICWSERDKNLKNVKRYEDKGFHLAIGEGKGWLGLVHPIIPALHPFCWKFYVRFKEPLYSACLNLNHGKTK